MKKGLSQDLPAELRHGRIRVRAVANIKIRHAIANDAGACGRIIYAAFGAINERYGFRSRWPSVSFATRFARDFITNPGIYVVIAELDHEIVGCNFLDERGPVRGIGPTAVAPSAQGQGIGRALMNNVLSRRGLGVRLLQDSFNATSLSLYASLGFQVREPIALMAGHPADVPTAPRELRPIRNSDFKACTHLCQLVHGFDRTAELRDAVRGTFLSPVTLIRDGRTTAYASGSGTFAYAVAETEQDMRELVLGGARGASESFEILLPMRYDSLLRWSLDQGFTVVKTMTLMTRGYYETPNGSWCPSVFY